MRTPTADDEALAGRLVREALRALAARLDPEAYDELALFLEDELLCTDYGQAMLARAASDFASATRELTARAEAEL
ncbi:MAG: hypothetical protein U0271_24310 [Polyangiaceae bacterium]